MMVTPAAVRELQRGSTHHAGALLPPAVVLTSAVIAVPLAADPAEREARRDDPGRLPVVERA